MALSVDYSVTPFLITIPKSDLTLVTGTKYQLTVDEFWLLLSDYTDDENTMAQPVLYSRIPATSSTPSITQINLTHYALEFEDGLYSVNIINGNTNIREAEVKNQVSVNTNNTTGFIDPVFLQTSTFVGKQGLGISVSPIMGLDSSSYPAGVRDTPCKTEANVNSIASVRGFNNVYVLDSINLSADHSANAHIFFGDNPQTINVNCELSSDVSNCKFQDCYVTGQLGVSGGNTIWECIVGDATNVNGFVYKSALLGSLTISGNTNIEDCFIASEAPDQEIDVDFDGLAKTVIIADWSAGRIRPINMVTGSFLGVSGTGGAVITDASTTGGTIVYAGAIRCDETHAANLDLLKDSTIAKGVWDKSKSIFTDTSTMGGYIARQLLTLRNFLGNK